MRTCLKLIAIAALACHPVHILCQATTNNNQLPFQVDSQAPVGSEKNPARVSSGVIAGLAISQPKPVIAPIPPGTKTSGCNVMRMILNPEGRVAHVEAVSGPEVFRDSTLDAIRRWTYKPYLLNGTAAWVRTTVTVCIGIGG